MQTEELREYLGIVVDMEKNLYLKEEAISSCKEKISILGIPKHISEPYMETTHWASYDIGDSLLTGAILGAIVGRIFFHSFLAGACIGALLGLVFTIIGTTKQNNAEELKVKQKNDLAMAQYRKLCGEDEERVQDELLEKAYYESILPVLEQELAQSQLRLEQIYARNVLFPKYRNLVMAASLYEYVCAGRCTELEGHEGAYNILEMEIRLDRIITQLDRVIFKLDQIKQNQYMLYSAIQDANRQSAKFLEFNQTMAYELKGQADTLNARIAEMQKTSALTAYCAERTQKELAYMNRMNYLAGRNDAAFWNLPPT